MLRHAVIVTVAVCSALAAATGLAGYCAPNATRGAAHNRVDTAAPPLETRVAVASLYKMPADAPSSVSPPGDAEVAKAKDGHYWAEAEINGRWIHCLIDTGATVVALTPADASRLGLDASALRYDVPVSTANGQGRAAQVDLDHVSVAGARVDHVAAMVVQEGLPASLLGMSYLGRLSRIEATPSTLILRR